MAFEKSPVDIAARAHLALVNLLKKYGCPIVDGTPVVAAVDKWLNRLCAPCEVCCKPQNEPCPVPMMSPVSSEQSVVFSVLRRLDALEKVQACHGRCLVTLLEQRKAHT